ncbi:hypothetical protein B0H11DRAFT_1915245 [Mycena galericulata]|nr:hypothetical protein B0H11DRAFT_1915245 [Mycena galericulata]
MSSLPIELESLILLYAIGDFQASDRVMHASNRRVLCLVCSAWCNIIYSTPSAWSKIYIALEVADSLDFVKFCLMNSKAADLTLFVDVHFCGRTPVLGRRPGRGRVLSEFVDSLFPVLKTAFLRITDLTVLCFDGRASLAIMRHLGDGVGNRLSTVSLILQVGSSSTISNPDHASRVESVALIGVELPFLTSFQFGYRSRSTVDFLSALDAPRLHTFRLDLYNRASISLLLSTCPHLIAQAHLADIKFSSGAGLESMLDLVLSFKRAAVFDFRRTPMRRSCRVNKLVRLASFKGRHIQKIMVASSLTDADIVNILGPDNPHRFSPFFVFESANSSTRYFVPHEGIRPWSLSAMYEISRSASQK